MLRHLLLVGASVAMHAPDASGLIRGRRTQIVGMDPYCGCAKENPLHYFTIACGAGHTEELEAAKTTLMNCPKTSAGCADELPVNDAQGNPTMPCQTAFYTLQSHHDYCLDTEVTDEIDLLVHEYEAVCNTCVIQRMYDPYLTSTCPIVDCDSPFLAATSFEVLNATCTESLLPGGNPALCCQDEADYGAYEIIMSYHDQCDVDVIPEYIERAFQLWEAPCMAARCNIADADYDGLECPIPPPLSPDADEPPPPMPNPPEPSPPPPDDYDDCPNCADPPPDPPDPSPPPPYDDDGGGDGDGDGDGPGCDDPDDPCPPAPPDPSPPISIQSALDDYFDNHQGWWIELSTLSGWTLFLSFVMLFMFIWLILQIRAIRKIVERRGGMPIYSRFDGRTADLNGGTNGVDMKMMSSSSSNSGGDVA